MRQTSDVELIAEKDFTDMEEIQKTVETGTEANAGSDPVVPVVQFAPARKSIHGTNCSFPTSKRTD
ncbi:hypothetical protein N7494_007633 [Penicillium frequentans]|uniref:Uncharacterized protein n=1 Tax=Penicillium frequentans TaxID=3151616 RepID=A0AAD6GED3_9EURO|nr:hypothetical protein N7494_007633 [Penicillium glabrum]